MSPQIVSAISGFSIVLIVFLSCYLLGDHLYLSDIILSVIILLCISGVSVLDDSTASEQPNISAFYILLLATFLLLLPLISKKIDNQAKTVLLAAYSGLTSGLSFVILNIAVKSSGGSLADLFSHVYIYEYTTVGFFLRGLDASRL